MDTKRIQIVIVDDHAVVRSGLSDFVMAFDDFELVGEADGGRQALTVCADAKPDVVLMDMVMPDMDGATATRMLREANPEVQIIALTSFREEELVNAALKAGAIGYLLKNITAEQLASAIRNASHGCPTFAPEATLVLMHAATAPPSLGHDLTPRERAILPLLVQGLNNTQIADSLGVELSTIKYHVSHIISKLGASNRTEASSLAIQHHLVN